MREACLGLAACLALTVLQTDFAQIRELIRQRRFPAAIEACDQELKTHPRDHRIWTLKGIALQLSGRAREESLAAFRKAVEIEPAYVPALEAEARLEYQARDPNCENTLARLLALRPGDASAEAMLGVLAFERHDCDASANHFAAAGTVLAKNAAALRQYGFCLFQTRRFEAASDQFQAAARLSENDRDRFNWAMAEFQARKFAEAGEVVRPLTLRSVPDSDALSLLAAAYESNQQTPEAVDALRRAIALYPYEERHYIDLASICLEHSALDLGIEILETGIKNLPRSARLHAILGMFHTKGGRFDQAQKEFERSTELDPLSAYGPVGLSLALVQDGRVEESVTILRRQHARDPGNARVSFALAEALLRDGLQPGQPEFEEAKGLLQAAIEKLPGEARAHALLGKILLSSGELASAIRELESAMTLNPQDRTATYQLMMAYGRSGEVEKARALQQRIRELLSWEKAEESERGRFRILRSAPDEPRK